MLKWLKVILVVSFFASCVSQKKFKELKEQNWNLSNVTVALDDSLKMLAKENDSLRRQNYILDSLVNSGKGKSDVADSGKRGVTFGKGVIKKSTLSEAEEYDKKALFIYNFTSYVSWGKHVGKEFVIAIAGGSPINNYIINYTKGKQFGNAPFVVENYIPGKQYQIVFVSNSEAKNYAKIKKEIGNKPTLVITENTLYNRMGAHICFYVDGDKVNFTVNKPSIQKSGLNVSSKLIDFSEK